jgi:hypothetical protein
MKKAILFFIGSIFLCSCELIVIGTKQPKQTKIEINQSNALGTALLFKTELDSGNAPAAVRLLATPDGKFFLAIQRYEMIDEIERLGRMIGDKPLTLTKIDTLSGGSIKVSLEFDYLWEYTFSTEKIDKNWFIDNYEGTTYQWKSPK